MPAVRMQALVLGGTGAMGADLVGKLAQREFSVTVTSRFEHEDSPGIHYVKGNAHNMSFLCSLLGRHWDCIVDFMSYGTEEFKRRAEALLNATDHYIFISSARVYAQSDGPITEELPRLLDVCRDEEYLATDEYALSKARQEDILKRCASEGNYTIVRPSLTYNSNRLQFALGEKEEWLYRACQGKSIVFPKDMKDIRTAMTWGGDVAAAIAKLAGNPKAIGQTVHVVREGSNTWQQILDVYQQVLAERLGHEAKVREIENALPAAEKLGRLYQIKYARAINREFDNSKLRTIIGEMEFISAEEGLKRCLNGFFDSGMRFGRIDVKTHAYYDRLCQEHTDLGANMMVNGYSDERAIQMLIALLKKYNIRKVIVSPGATNLNFVGSLEYDGGFEMYSCPDEKSAAYMACGLSAQSGEPVVITCTMATASREYLAGLSEAYYRKLPILAVTGTKSLVNEGHLIPQYVDRTSPPKDAVRYSVQIQYVRGMTDEWDCMIKMNRAIQALFRDGGGPVLMNLTTVYSDGFTCARLPETRMIRRYGRDGEFPPISKDKKRIAITVGAHKRWDKALEKAVGRFCMKYGAVVLADHAGGYSGDCRIHPTLLAAQELYEGELLSPDLLIHIGEQSADYYTYNRLMGSKEVWRVSEDGQIRDTFHHLTKLFDMPEVDFFEAYADGEAEQRGAYYSELKEEIDGLYARIPQLPFSNVWIAKVMAERMPGNSVVHFGLSNSMRSWTFFDFSNSGIVTSANVGCRGIDGSLSALVGASLACPDTLCFGVVGDLTFFYDMNVLGNRHIRNNLRILLVNNDGGTEFHLHQHIGHRVIGEENVGNFVAADGHNGRKSKTLVKHFAEDLGFDYRSASDKGELLLLLDWFLSPSLTEKPLILEAFTKHEDERDAVRKMREIWF